VEPVASRPQYLFIHTVRFWCMLAIVLMHGVLMTTFHARAPGLEIVMLIQGLKFGTIGFFLISGFLLGDRLPATKPFSYLRRRASRLVPAWCVWFVLQVLFWAAQGVRHWSPTIPPAHAIAAALWLNAVACFTGTALWFVPNFMIALTCVVLLRRWLNDLRLGAVLLAINLFYTVNVYMSWIPSKHSEALFGFVFYLWLGAWCAQRKDAVQRWAAALSSWRLILCAILAAGAALIETRLLIVHHNEDILNTLRLSNQVFSVVIVILLVRVRRVTWPRFIDVGAQTYGIYLTHTIILTAVFSAAARLTIGQGHRTGPVGFVVMWALLAPTSYLLSLLLTRWIATSRWPWLVGAASARAEKAAAAETRPNRLEAVPAAR
jgi:peptidoglycan/LPS O-acetylase OafA/YrhL